MLAWRAAPPPWLRTPRHSSVFPASPSDPLSLSPPLPVPAWQHTKSVPEPTPSSLRSVTPGGRPQAGRPLRPGRLRHRPPRLAPPSTPPPRTSPCESRRRSVRAAPAAAACARAPRRVPKARTASPAAPRRPAASAVGTRRGTPPSRRAHRSHAPTWAGTAGRPDSRSAGRCRRPERGSGSAPASCRSVRDSKSESAGPGRAGPGWARGLHCAASTSSARAASTSSARAATPTRMAVRGGPTRPAAARVPAAAS